MPHFFSIVTPSNSSSHGNTSNVTSKQMVRWAQLRLRPRSDHDANIKLKRNITITKTNNSTPTADFEAKKLAINCWHRCPLTLYHKVQT